MPSEWADVEALIRELGAVRAAAFAARASDAADAAIEQAIGEATQAVVDTLTAPQDARAIARAREAIEVADSVIGALDEEAMRSLRARVRGADLRGRAKELVERARLQRVQRSGG